jgi:hypothetical protein
MVPVARLAVAERRMKNRSLQRIIEFPKLPSADDVISERIIFEVGDTRFAMQWIAEIEQLPPSGPIVAERKRRLNSTARLS